jgi:ribonuclease HII
MFTPTLTEEKKLWRRGFLNIAGVDEVGRGSWAGPLVVGACILPKNFQIPQGFGDSKQVKPQARKRLVWFIKEQAKAWNIAEISVLKINKLGLAKASHMAFRKALASLEPRPDFVLVDAFYIRHVNRKNQKPIVDGDQKSASIAAASILAKVYRDDLMRKLSRKYPQYGFGKNKGYGTKRHQQAIKEHGFSRIHRKSFNLSFLFSS